MCLQNAESLSAPVLQSEKAARDQVEVNDYLTSLHNDLTEGNRKEYRAKDYANILHPPLVALTYLSYEKKKMQEASLFDKWTL